MYIRRNDMFVMSPLKKLGKIQKQKNEKNQDSLKYL